MAPRRIAPRLLDAFAPAGAMPFTPHAVYRVWWTEIPALRRPVGDFDRVEWYEVPGSSYSCPAYEGRCDGWWRSPHTIYMAQGQLYDRPGRRHEMLHDLLQRGTHHRLFQACRL